MEVGKSVKLYTMNKKITSLIPFYNESDNILSILKMLTNVSQISQIICIDDGSKNNLYEKIKKSFPNVELIQNKINIGKAGSIFKATEKSNNEDVLLLDADLVDLSVNEVSHAIDLYKTNNLDMLILENKGDNNFIDSILRKTIIQSGKRILTKTDLLKIAKRTPEKYQLEVAINQYMHLHNKKIAWIKSNSFNPHKKKKIGLIKGIIEDHKMNMSIVNYLGLKDYISQLLFFCKKEII